MKRWNRAAALLLIICMLLCLSACSSKTGEPNTNDSDTQNIQNTQKVDPEPSGTPAAPSAPDTEASSGIDPDAEDPLSPSPSVADVAQMLTLQKQLYGLYDWDDDALLVQSEFSHVTLWDEDAAKYPQLAEALNQTANMIRRSMEDEYDNLCASAREDLTWTKEDMFPWVSTLDIQVRRADSVVLSLLSDSYSDYGWIEDFRGMHGTNYDTQTGQELALNDVVDVNNDLAEAVIKELNSHQWAGDFDYRDAVEAYFANTPYDSFSWTLDYNGVTFYFADGELTEAGNGRQTATVSFAEYPELFEEKYMAVPEAYMVALPLDSSYFTDLDDDGDLEELNVTAYYNSDVGSYSQFGIYADADGSYQYEECFADGFIPYYVKTADGHHYLYLFCEQDEGSGPIPMMLLVVFDVSGGRLTRVGEMNAAPGYIPDGIYRVPTDPNRFYLDDFDSMAQDMMLHTVDISGMPVLLEQGLRMPELEAITWVEIDHFLLSGIRWHGYAKVNPQSGATEWLVEEDGQSTFFVYCDADGTGYFEMPDQTIPFTWEPGSDGYACFTTAEGINYYASLCEEVICNGDAIMYWLFVQMEEANIWLY